MAKGASGDIGGRRVRSEGRSLEGDAQNMGTSVGAMGPTVAEKVGTLWSSLPHIEAMAAITADWSTPEGVEDGAAAVEDLGAAAAAYVLRGVVALGSVPFAGRTFSFPGRGAGAVDVEEPRISVRFCVSDMLAHSSCEPSHSPSR